jgi:hypothetical protein
MADLGASRNQQGANTGGRPDNAHIQLSNICKAVSTSGKVTGVSNLLAMVTGAVTDSQPAAGAPPGGVGPAPLVDPGATMPQKDIQMGVETAWPVMNRRQ